MLDMGFVGPIKSLVRDYGMPRPGARQTLMFSATFPVEVQQLAREFLNDYLFLTVGVLGGAASDVVQTMIMVEDDQKRDKLVEILSASGRYLKQFLIKYSCGR